MSNSLGRGTARYVMYGTRPQAFKNEQQRAMLADALEELAQVV